jgi:hypothetical protein
VDYLIRQWFLPVVFSPMIEREVYVGMVARAQEVDAKVEGLCGIYV